ncbi:TrbC/VirB2 family protein [Fervidobacterium sp.]
MEKVKRLWIGLRHRSQVSWALATALVYGLGSQAYANTVVNTVTTAMCNIYNNVLKNNGMIFAIVLVIIAWAGYMVYMGKREATDVIIKAVIATAIILGGTQLAGWVISGSCSTGSGGN